MPQGEKEILAMVDMVPLDTVTLVRRSRAGVGVQSNTYGSRLCTSMNSNVATDGTTDLAYFCG